MADRLTRARAVIMAAIGILIVGCAAPAAPAASASADPNAVHPGKLVVLLPELGNERFDFLYRTSSTGASTYHELLHSSLLATGSKGEAVPAIAKEWSFSPDFKTLTFLVRSGVKFHDGSDLTAQDVLWTLEHSFGAKAGANTTVGPVVSISKAFKSVELVGTDTIKYTSGDTTQVLAVFSLIQGNYGSNRFGLLPKPAAGATDADFDKKPIGAGPMRFVAHTPNASMEFERFDDYFYQPKNGLTEDRRVRFKSLKLDIVPEEAARVAAIQSGKADIAPVSWSSRKAIESAGGRIVSAPEARVFDIRFLGCWGTPVYPCHDVRVRQALDFALNKEEMRDKLFGGPDAFQVKGWVVVTPTSVGYSPSLDPRPFDPNKARQLLADAGYPGGKGFGKLIVNTYPSSGLPYLVESAQLAAEYWKRELGLDVEVRVAEQNVVSEREAGDQLRGQILWRESEARFNPDVTILGAGYGNPKRGPRMFHNDAALFKKVQDALAVTDPVKLAANAKELYPVLRDLDLQISIGYANLAWAVGPRVAAWTPEAITGSVSNLYTLRLK